ncbi:hypothetical protein [Sandarakinorhabdus sp.]|uniref:hypothetical protein n=1 Tax=Sandarakinorhabdus sp. TaxID=1916663 RepID=UPI00286DC0FD|nr:hypothetical protein [Sandarakinorhabdus sp.]
MSLPNAPSGPPGEIDWAEAADFGLSVSQWLFLAAGLVLCVQWGAGVATGWWLPLGVFAIAGASLAARRYWRAGVMLRALVAGIAGTASVWALFKALGRLL